MITHARKHATEYNDLADYDGLKLVVLGLQADIGPLAVEGLDGGLVLEQCDHDVAVIYFRRFFNYYNVTAEDTDLNHRVAFDLEGKKLA